jgi:hypothetical protein
MTRGFNTNFANQPRFLAFESTDGWTTDGTSRTNDGPYVAKFSDGSVIGNPYVKSTTHANNTTDRGTRFNFAVPMVVSGVYIGVVSSSLSAIKIYQGASEVASLTPDLNQKNNIGWAYFDASLTLTANTAYDFVYKLSGNSTFGPRIDADASPPADVLLAMPTNQKCVDGTAGSYTAVDGFVPIGLLVDSIPAAGGTTVF